MSEENLSNKNQSHENSDGSSSDNFGQWLKRKREEKNIDLEEISNATKIQKKQLEKLENEELDNLPPLAFVRGFVMNYCRYLGVDEAEALSRLEQSKIVESYEKSMKQKQSSSVSSGKKITFSVDPNEIMTRPAEMGMGSKIQIRGKYVLIPVLIFLLIIGFSYLVSLGKTKKNVDEEVSTEVVKNDQAAASKDEAKSAKSNDAANTTAETKAGEKAAEKAVEKPVVEKKVEPKVFKLGLVGVDTSWVNLRVDQRKPFGIQLKKGSTKFFDVKERAILSFNNAGAVELLWGKDLYNSPGEIGEMKALNLPGDLKTLAKKVKQ